MKVTVITVCLNAAATISETLASVLAAGDEVFEYLVVDGGSTDGTVELLRDHEPRFAGRMRWSSEPDDGIYDAMNRGLERANGEYVLFLGGDDRLVDGALGALAEALAKQVPPADMVFGDVRVMGADRATRVERGCERPGRVGPIPRAMPACHQASLYSVEACRELGGFNTEFKIAADYDLYLRLVEAGKLAVHVPVVIAEFSLAGVSASRGVATAQDYRRVWVKHGVSPGAAWLRMVRSIVNLKAVSAWRRVAR